MNTYQTLLDYCQIHNTTLVAVSKTKPIEAIQELYDQGQRIFGENRVQELTQKHEAMANDIEWHMIGHLQTNKVKFIAPFVSMIHSGDRISLLKEINKEAAKVNRVIDVLLQVKIAQEDSKYGWSESELHEALEGETIQKYEHLNIRGVMGMATFTDKENQVRAEFKTLKDCFDKIKSNIFEQKNDFDIISMGMSGDYKIAIQEGSNMVRVGSLLFGARG